VTAIDSFDATHLKPGERLAVGLALARERQTFAAVRWLQDVANLSAALADGVVVSGRVRIEPNRAA
jgi:hypothetical protein